MQWDFVAGFDRLIERGNQFQALSSLEAVHQGRTLMDQTIHDMLIIGLMAEAIHVRRIDRELLDDVLVRRKFIDKAPMPDLVDGETGDLNGTLFSQDRERAFEIGWAR